MYSFIFNMNTITVGKVVFNNLRFYKEQEINIYMCFIVISPVQIKINFHET